MSRVLDISFVERMNERFYLLSSYSGWIVATELTDAIDQGLLSIQLSIWVQMLILTGMNTRYSNKKDESQSKEASVHTITLNVKN